jgi:hypothetical protein
MTTQIDRNKQKLNFGSFELHNACGCLATVLIVEDNLYNVVPVKMILRQTYDLTLERASNGLEGIEMFKKDLFKTCCDVRY